MGLGDLFDPRAFALGMLGLINPCGFALLPAYLGYFLGSNQGEDRRSRLVALNQAQVVGLSLSAGFLVVFGVLGLGLAGLLTALGNAGILYWATLVVGIGLVGLGVAMLTGYQPVLSLPKMERGTGSRSAPSMFLFGVSYAVASLACTIPLFMNTVAISADGSSYVERLGRFISYAAGMGLLATGLTMAVALGKQGVVDRFRRLLPHLHTISAVVVIAVGAYVAWYGYWSTDPINNPAGPVLWVEARQNELARWVNDRTAVLGSGFLLANLGLAAAGLAARRWHRPSPAERDPAPVR